MAGDVVRVMEGVCSCIALTTQPDQVIAINDGVNVLSAVLAGVTIGIVDKVTQQLPIVQVLGSVEGKQVAVVCALCAGKAAAYCIIPAGLRMNLTLFAVNLAKPLNFIGLSGEEVSASSMRASPYAGSHFAIS